MSFDAEVETKKIIDFIKKYFKKNKIDGVVMGISGGKDSTIASALFAKAIGKENVVGITLPCNSLKSDEDDAKRVADYIGFKLYRYDLGDVYNIFNEGINNILEIPFNDKSSANMNLKPRLRMSTLYYLAQVLSDVNNKRYIVAGTGNRCERFVGYFTKFGDGASDINILADLSVDEIREIGMYLGLSKDLVYKTPSDGLTGISDEEKLKVTYEQIENYINIEDDIERIGLLHLGALHKLNPIPEYRKINVDEKVDDIIKALIKNKETVATMESCTGGFLASTFTDIPKASKIFKYGANTYSDEAKIKMGVKALTIKEKSVYSREVAQEMAFNILKFAKADYGVGITGEIVINMEISNIYVCIYNKKIDKYYDFIIKVREPNRKWAKEKIVQKVIYYLWSIICENKENFVI